MVGSCATLGSTEISCRVSSNYISSDGNPFALKLGGAQLGSWQEHQLP
jgi:hypothetical protein